MELVTVEQLVAHLQKLPPRTYVFALPFGGDSCEQHPVNIRHEKNLMLHDVNIYRDRLGNLFAGSDSSEQETNEILADGNQLCDTHANVITLTCQLIKYSTKTPGSIFQQTE